LGNYALGFGLQGEILKCSQQICLKLDVFFSNPPKMALFGKQKYLSLPERVNLNSPPTAGVY
jgi:hypothetical protein